MDAAQNGHIFSNKTFLKTFYENGNYKKIQSYDSLGVKNGNWMDFYENGQIKIEQHYTNKNIDLRNSANKNSYGNRIKKFNFFYPNGQIQFSLNYSNDKIDNGLFVEYYSSGQKKISGNLKNGLRDSEWAEYYENGEIKYFIILKYNHYKAKLPINESQLAVSIFVSVDSYYISILAYFAFCSINSLRGGTSSPINIENVLSASIAFSMTT